MTRQDSLQWMYSKEGQSLDFDGVYGAQCFDYFNFDYEYLTGRNPYADGYAVSGAKEIWNVPTDLFTKIPNNVNDPNQVPQTGDILVYNGSWGAGFGHVELCESADGNGVNVSAQNSKGPYVASEFRPWRNVTGGLIGWLSFNGFTTDQPAPAPEPQPAPDPTTPPTPDPTTTTTETTTTTTSSSTTTTLPPIPPTKSSRIKRLLDWVLRFLKVYKEKS